MSKQLIDSSQNSGSHNCPIKNNDSRVNKIYGQSYRCYLVDIQRVRHEKTVMAMKGADDGVLS